MAQRQCLPGGQRGRGLLARTLCADQQNGQVCKRGARAGIMTAVPPQVDWSRPA